MCEPAALLSPGEARKVFSTTIDVPNPIHFCTEKTSHLIKDIEARFVGQCYQAALILGDVEVLKQSACRINDSNNSGEAVVDVQFAATVKEFCTWDILVGVEIIGVAQFVYGNYTIRANSGRPIVASVVLYTFRGVETLMVGQRIPVRLIMKECWPMQAPTVFATLLTCERTAVIYKLQGSLTVSTAGELLTLVAQIEREIGLRAALMRTHERAISFFETLLYAHKAPVGAPAPPCSHKVALWGAAGPAGEAAEWAGPPPLQPVDPRFALRSLPELVRAVARAGQPASVAGYWTRPLSVHRSGPAVAHAESLDPADAQSVLEEPVRVAFAQMLKNALDFLVAVRELAADHPAPEAEEAYSALWATMRAAQM